MLLDPVVGQLTAPTVTPAMVGYMQAAWQQGLSFKELYAGAPDALKFQLPSYYRSRALCATQEAAGLSVMGTTLAGDCAHWSPPPPPPQAFECVNDGAKCVPSTRPLKAGVVWANATTCDAHCKGGRWACRQNPELAGCAGKNAVMCVPDAFGPCPDLAPDTAGPWSAVSMSTISRKRAA